MVRIQVLDVNDNIPQLSQSICSTLFQDNTLNLQIQGTDEDNADNLQYYLEEDSATFHLDSETGVLSLKSDTVGGTQPRTSFLRAYAKDLAGHRSPSSDIFINCPPGPKSDVEEVKSRSRRAVRTEMVYAVRHDREGDLFQIAKQDNNERFAFSGSAPQNLMIEDELGIISRPPRHQWNSDTSVLTFSVNITLQNDSGCKYVSEMNVINLF